MPDQNLTDLGNSERLVANTKDDMRYCPAWRSWLHWDGRHWATDDSTAIMERAKSVIAYMQVEAQGANNEEYMKWAQRSEDYHHITAMIKLCSQTTGVTVSPEDFDTNPMLLNCINGVVDLESGQLLPHDRAYMMTRLVPVVYRRTAEAPRWRQFMHEIMSGNGDLVYFLQKALGYSLTGSTREQCMFILYGKGANGKSTFIEAIRSVLGDYSRAADPMVFTTRRQDSIRTDLIRLRGSRFVSAVELNQDARVVLDAALVKQMSGNDTLSARMLFSNTFYEFVPSWKVWLSTNPLPHIPGTDQGIWRRIRLIRFAASFEGDDADKKIDEKLAQEKEGILAWLVEGCMRWQREGLEPPASVQREVNAYREELDPLAGFIRDKCLVHDEAIIPSTELYEAYTGWCQEARERPMGKHLFGQSLKLRPGIEQERTNTQRFWTGICLGRQAIKRVHVLSVSTGEDDA